MGKIVRLSEGKYDGYCRAVDVRIRLLRTAAIKRALEKSEECSRGTMSRREITGAAVLEEWNALMPWLHASLCGWYGACRGQGLSAKTATRLLREFVEESERGVVRPPD